MSEPIDVATAADGWVDDGHTVILTIFEGWAGLELLCPRDPSAAEPDGAGDPAEPALCHITPDGQVKSYCLLADEAERVGDDFHEWMTVAGAPGGVIHPTSNPFPVVWSRDEDGLILLLPVAPPAGPDHTDDPSAEPIRRHPAHTTSIGDHP